MNISMVLLTALGKANELKINKQKFYLVVFTEVISCSLMTTEVLFPIIFLPVFCGR